MMQKLLYSREWQNLTKNLFISKYIKKMLTLRSLFSYSKHDIKRLDVIKNPRYPSKHFINVKRFFLVFGYQPKQEYFI